MTSARKPNLKLALGIPLMIFISCYIITLTSKFRSNQDLLSSAIVFDLLITAPLLYFIAIRKTGIPKLTVFRIFLAGVLFTGWILNTNSNAFLPIIRTWISPVIEIALITFIVRKFYSAGKEVRHSGKENTDFLIFCRKILCDVFGNEKAGNIIASEIGVFYYAFFLRKYKNNEPLSKFRSYKENGILPILGIFLSLFLIETTAFHFLLLLWNSTIAWIITALNLYTCLQLFAHIRAIKARPVTLKNNSLEIYNGLAGDAVICFDNIEKVEYNDKTPSDREAVKIALLRKLEKHNCIVYLKQPVQVTMIFGIKKKADAVMFYADRIEEFSKELNCRLRTLIIVN